MRILISPISLEEARTVVNGGADVVDIKNVDEGSLGAQGPWVPQAVINEFSDRDVIFSVALGDLPYKPGTAALAAYGAACVGANYIKAGLYGMSTYEESLKMMEGIVRGIRMVSNEPLAVGAGYADYRLFGGVSYKDVVRATRDAKADVVMLDTAMKKEGTLFDAMTMDEIQEFVDLAHEAELLVALAGSVKKEDMAKLAETGADIVGVRGAVCPGGDRTQGITEDGVRAFMEYVQEFQTPEKALAR